MKKTNLLLLVVLSMTITGCGIISHNDSERIIETENHSIIEEKEELPAAATIPERHEESVEYALSSEEANGAVLTSEELLATEDSAVIYTFADKTYKAYNGYIKNTSFASWEDAYAFVNKLNDKMVNGHTNWKLFGCDSVFDETKDNGLVQAYQELQEEIESWKNASFGADGIPISDDFGDVRQLWTLIRLDEDEAFAWTGAILIKVSEDLQWYGGNYIHDTRRGDISNETGFVVICEMD